MFSLGEFRCGVEIHRFRIYGETMVPMRILEISPSPFFWQQRFDVVHDCEYEDFSIRGSFEDEVQSQVSSGYYTEHSCCSVPSLSPTVEFTGWLYPPVADLEKPCSDLLLGSRCFKMKVLACQCL